MCDWERYRVYLNADGWRLRPPSGTRGREPRSRDESFFPHISFSVSRRRRRHTISLTPPAHSDRRHTDGRHTDQRRTRWGTIRLPVADTAPAVARSFIITSRRRRRRQWRPKDCRSRAPPTPVRPPTLNRVDSPTPPPSPQTPRVLIIGGVVPKRNGRERDYTPHTPEIFFSFLDTLRTLVSDLQSTQSSFFSFCSQKQITDKILLPYYAWKMSFRMAMGPRSTDIGSRGGAFVFRRGTLFLHINWNGSMCKTIK